MPIPLPLSNRFIIANDPLIKTATTLVVILSRAKQYISHLLTILSFYFQNGLCQTISPLQRDASAKK